MNESAMKKHYNEGRSRISYLNRFLLYFLVAFIITSCGLFETRTPESPTKDKSSYLPPTSANIVISNFINAIQEKNSENYTANFSTDDSEIRFVFQATANAHAIYTSLFESWDIDDERRAFLSMISNLQEETKPVLSISNQKFDVLSPDSAVFVADYLLNISHDMGSIDTDFSGTLQFTLFPKTDGLWCIQRWVDIKTNEDSLESWSILKAVFAN
jgi:hypothetical protein